MVAMMMLMLIHSRRVITEWVPHIPVGWHKSRISTCAVMQSFMSLSRSGLAAERGGRRVGKYAAHLVPLLGSGFHAPSAACRSFG